jgi:cellulose synthase/poly-beta-1,6-N-acetylglucosamine synthase-like glycosyltransferase
MTPPPQNSPGISVIVPARNEEAVIAGCIESLVQQEEIAEITVVNDQSTDRTAEIVRGLAAKYSRVKMIEVAELPAGWVGKNYAVWLGARQARGEWLLFTDADAVHEKHAAARAMEIARDREAALVSFSPEQIMETWYEKALIPYVYNRLAKKFSYEQVNNPQKTAAAANGQFLLIRRDAYEAVGGHASIAGEVLEDVLLAKKVKGAGYRIWFGSGKGIVRVRMYRSFRAMWGGWKKNLYQLMGGSSEAVTQEIAAALAPVIAVLVATTTVWGFTESAIRGLATLAVGILIIYVAYDGELQHNGFPARLVWYGIRGRLLYAGVVVASYRGHVRGKLEWKGRTYPVGTPGASKG